MAEELKAFHNREVLKTVNLSGHAYVAAMVRQPEGKGDTDLQKIAISSAGRCGHINLICTVCAPAWEQDWVLLYDRTEGGRVLKNQL